MKSFINSIRSAASELKKGAKSLGNLAARGMSSVGLMFKSAGNAVTGAETGISRLKMVRAGLATQRFTASLGTVMSHKSTQKAVASIYKEIYMFYARYLNKFADEMEKLQADKDLNAEMGELSKAGGELADSMVDLWSDITAVGEAAFASMKESDEWKDIMADMEKAHEDLNVNHEVDVDYESAANA